ncbi:ribosome maturation factor RimP [Salinicola aestuarinus]|uniref:ribosome maturation factor RimP n=1 Tax=Salinicola aestuarinus TaxID=1949082 RepID=UPI000DA22092|nr:ribosome maturation factor RimP [Salinicola aestuarinus]
MVTKDAALYAIIEPVVTAMGFELWGLDYLAQGKHSKLMIYIDSPNGITVDDCAGVSRQVSSVLDVEDPISSNYYLEVSSPGLDRPLYTLDHFSRFRGHMVQLKLRSAFDGRRKFQGQLAGVDGDEVLIRIESEEYCFPIESIDQARVIPQFED